MSPYLRIFVCQRVTPLPFFLSHKLFTAEPPHRDGSGQKEKGQKKSSPESRVLDSSTRLSFPNGNIALSGNERFVRSCFRRAALVDSRPRLLVSSSLRKRGVSADSSLIKGSANLRLVLFCFSTLRVFARFGNARDVLPRRTTTRTRGNRNRAQTGQ